MSYLWDSYYRRHNPEGIKSAGPAPKPSREHIARVRAWYRVWHSLTRAQQDAWQALSRAEKDATYRMNAAEFAAFAKGLGQMVCEDDCLDFGESLEAGHGIALTRFE